MDIVELLSLRATRKILNELQEKGAARYSELVKVVGHSTMTTRALKRMEQLRIVRRRVLDEPHRPVEYSLTENGERLATLVRDSGALD
jgi:DNA-binding HxlR family transcriptional regulator